MDRLVDIAFGSILGAGAVIVVACTTVRTAPEPVQQSPRYYTVHLDNARVRVLEYRLPPGQSEPMHRHPAGVVYYFNDASVRVILPGAAPAERRITGGEVIWREPLSHAITNTGPTEVHALAVELKSCGR